MPIMSLATSLKSCRMGVVAGEDAFIPRYLGAGGVATLTMICSGGVVGRGRTTEREAFDALSAMIEGWSGAVDASVLSWRGANVKITDL